MESKREAPESCFCDMVNRETKEVVAGVTIQTFWGEKMLVSMVSLAAHATVPTHFHPHEQVGTVLTGEMELTIGGETRWLKEGDTYIIPANLEHQARTESRPAKVVDVFSPAREDYKY